MINFILFCHLSKVVLPFYIPSSKQCMILPVTPHSCQYLVLLLFLILASINLGYSWVYVVLPHCGLVNVPSMTDDVKYLFMYIAHFCTWVEC